MSTVSSSTPRPGPTGGPGNNNGTSSNNNNNNTLDNFMGTNVYLYGFLSTLILIFLVSVAVAYKGYRTRALLRQRIDQALAAGVFIPGVSSDDGPGTRRRRDAGERPVMSEVWLHRGTNIDKWVQLQVLDIYLHSNHYLLILYIATQPPTRSSTIHQQRTNHPANPRRMGCSASISTQSPLLLLPQPTTSFHSRYSSSTTPTAPQRRLGESRA
jgi:hypothetical protein